MVCKGRHWWRVARGLDHAPGEPQRRPVEEVRWRAGGVAANGGPESKEDEWKVVHPAGAARSTDARDEAVLEGPVLPFDHTVALGMVGGGELPGGAQEVRELAPDVGGGLSALVHHDRVRAAKPGNPDAEERAGTRLGSDVHQRNCL